jgi:hypothetical protein
MRGKTATLLNRFCRVVGIVEKDQRKELKRRWKSLSHKEKGQESAAMKEKISNATSAS